MTFNCLVCGLPFGVAGLGALVLVTSYSPGVRPPEPPVVITRAGVAACDGCAQQLLDAMADLEQRLSRKEPQPPVSFVVVVIGCNECGRPVQVLDPAWPRREAAEDHAKAAHLSHAVPPSCARVVVLELGGDPVDTFG